MNKSPLYPFVFHPIFKERIWGGRKLQELYGKPLPPKTLIGESWEISDRPGDSSVVANGAFTGKDIRWLMANHEKEIMGLAHAVNGRFPLLVKILDAQEDLSLQVHPPAAKATALGGDPKTEMWYFTDCTEDAAIYVGLKKGVTRQIFEEKTHHGNVAECFHKVHVKKSDAMFLPSGRVHALGSGSVLFEIQQNSDTTYRVFDWNRVGLDGKPRELHIPQSLASIDFEDFEPSLITNKYSHGDDIQFRPLVTEPLFTVNTVRIKRDHREEAKIRKPQILGVLKGKLSINHEQSNFHLTPGQFCLLPASLNRYGIIAETQAEYLVAEPH